MACRTSPEKFRDLVAFLGSLNGEEETETRQLGQSPASPVPRRRTTSGGDPAAVEPALGSAP